jgi:hypothetical protein
VSDVINLVSKERKKLDHVKKLILFSETKKLTI